MNDAQRSFFNLAFDAGHQAWQRGIPRDQVPVDLIPAEIIFWHSGWDCGLFEEAVTAGAFAAFTATNPYPAGSEAASWWIKGWHGTHGLAALSG